MHHVHENCPFCTYLGSDNEPKIDYYVCRSKTEDTLIGRYGPDGEYASGTCFYPRNPLINRAGNLAMSWGLLTLADINEHLRTPISAPIFLEARK